MLSMMGDLMKRTPAVNKPTVRRILEAWVTASWVIASEIVGSLEAIFVQFVYKGVCGGEVMGERSEKKKKKKRQKWLVVLGSKIFILAERKPQIS